MTSGVIRSSLQTPTRVLLLGALALLQCCTFFGEPDAPPPLSPTTTPPALNSIEIFLSRSELRKTDFEHFKIEGSSLFIECGEIHRGRNSPREQSLTHIETASAEAIAHSTWELASEISKQHPQFDEPGKNSDLADPGQLFVNIDFEGTALKVETSLDSISPATSTATALLLTLTEQTRSAAGGTLCGLEQFYGVKAHP